MYAHQVIEDITDNPIRTEILKQCTNEQRECYLQYIDVFLNELKNSIQFNFGDFYDLYSFFGIDIQRDKVLNDFFIKTVGKMNFPFEKSYFEFSANKSATIKDTCSIIFSGEEKFIHIVSCHKDNQTKKFFLNPVYLQISKDSLYRQETYGINFLPENFREYFRIWLSATAAICVIAQKILQCKNISTEKNYPPEALNKKRIKQGKQPLFTYHTLVVNPMSEKTRSDGPHETTGIKQRLHFCRGHFKEYTEQNKLFGKHTGLYWWQPMVRGNKELGLVHKDYQVKAA